MVPLRASLDVENRGRFAELRGTWSGRATGRRFDDNHPDAPRTDVEYCLQADRFDLALSVTREDGLLVARWQ
ncbi:MAG: hypothetical protein HZB53_19170 [Chloroflexi bacterium]|nr:hypothetical protein [Chloroflexota bacterium]